MEELIFEVNENVATITLNRPDKYNSINKNLAFGIQSSLDQCENDENIRCIVITGKGKAFCAGQDLAEVVAADSLSLSSIVETYYNPIITKIRNIKKPVIAAVNGVAAGAGANIALACDIVIAHENASFIQALSKIGLIPDSAGTYILPRLIGFQRASALIMTGDKVSAAEAFQMGMIYKMYDENTFENSYKSLALTLSKMPTYALGLSKMALNKSMNNTLESQLSLEHEYQTLAGNSYDYNEGVQAFIEKRKAEFKGK
ncbi:MAG TPA: enoyl-CoA hydratase-related protein [Saprospiraceae bacterium]|nr:enoyl-CoA hydratase-related protein [Saprospiraceae bacterium]